jgi:glycerophosphoryl diester phosphodiesterase
LCVLLAEVNNLKYARRRSQLPIVQLTGGPSGKLADNSYANYGALLADLPAVASYAQGLGPSKGTLLTNWNKNTQSLQPGTSGDPIVTSARAAGLQVRWGVV